MKLAIWAMGSVFVFSSLVVWVTTHPNRDRVALMSTELDDLHAQNDALAEENRRLARDVEALKTDPRTVARKAREVGPYVGKNEYVVQLKTRPQPTKVDVLVRAESDHVSVAGKASADENLASALERFSADTDGARFVLEHGKEVEPERVASLRRIVTEFNQRQASGDER